MSEKKRYDYSREGSNIYKRSAKTKPVLTDESLRFKETTALWRKKEELLAKEQAEERAQKMFIAEQVIGSFSGSKRLLEATNKHKWEKDLKPLVTGATKIKYDSYDTNMSVFKKVTGFLRGGAAGNIMNPKLEFTDGFLTFLQDSGNYSEFMQSEAGQEILDIMSNSPGDFDRLPGFSRKQWKDLQKNAGGVKNWQEYIQEQKDIDSSIWENADIFDLLDLSSVDPSILSPPPSQQTDNFLTDNDIIDTEVEEMLDQWDYTWFNFDNIDTTDTGGTV